MKTIVFDFDGTLTPHPIPRYKLFQMCGLPTETEEFIRLSERLCKEYSVGKYELLFRLLFDCAHELGLPLNEPSLCIGAEDVPFNSGVESFFKETLGKANLYVLTCGYSGYILRTRLAPYLSGVLGTTFSFENGIATGVAELLSDTKKVGALDRLVGGDFRNIMYVGDGPTDMLVFRHVLQKGGLAVMVHQQGDSYPAEILKANGMQDVPCLTADYTEGSELRTLLDSYIFE
jgi:hypothetical protein